MPVMTRTECRKLLFGKLWEWGDITKHGYLPGQGDGISSGNKPGSRPPLPLWVSDVDRAFANLNPATYGLGADLSRVWLVTAPYNLQQNVLWQFYVEGLGCVVRKPIPDELADNPRELRRQDISHEAAGDVLVGKALGISDSWAAKQRRWAISAMVDMVRWHLDEEAA